MRRSSQITPRVALVAGLMLLSACATHDLSDINVIEEIERAEQFNNASDDISVPSDRSAKQWWNDIGGEELSSLVTELRQESLALEAARARLMQSRALARQARGALLPSLSATADTGQFKLIEPQELEWEDTYTAGLSASWTFDIFGELRNADRAAQLRASAAELSYRSLEQSLIAELARAYIRAYTLEQRLKISKEVAKSFQDTSELTSARYENGSRTVTALDVQIARQNAASAAANVPALEADLAIQFQAIDILLGRLPGVTKLTFADLEEPAEVPMFPAGAPADILLTRPDLGLSALQYRAALHDVGAARARLFPQITLSANLSESSSPTNILGSETLIANLTAGLVGPLFQGGRRRADVRRAKAVSEELAADLGQLALTAMSDVEAALIREASTSTELKLRGTSLEAATISDQIASERYAAGQVNLLTVLETRRALDTARQEHLLSEQARWNARIDLYEALGGQWFSEREEDVAS